MEEVFKDVVGFEDYFQISNLGRLFSKRSNKILKLHTNKSGYVSLATKIGGRQGINHCFKLHRVVAEAFLHNPDNKPEVNHKDGIKSNNIVTNLEWSTKSENIQHCNNLGLKRVGINSPYAKLNSKQVKKIRESNNTNASLAREMQVSESTIAKVIAGTRYKDYDLLA